MGDGDYDKFYVSAGREVIINFGKENVFTTFGLTPLPKLIFTDDVTLGLKSSYKNLVEGNSSSLLTVLAGATKGAFPSGQFGLQGLQIWESTDVLSFNINVALHMQTSGKTDVVIPALTLAKLCLPSYTTKKDGKHGMGLVPPGPNLSTILNLVGAQLNIIDGDIGNRNISPTGGGLLSITIGNYLTLDNVVLTGVDPTFSNVLDEDFMPVSCKLQLEFRTVEIATIDMMDRMIKHVQGATSTIETTSTPSFPQGSNIQ